jgi:hypothetical protein
MSNDEIKNKKKIKKGMSFKNKSNDEIKNKIKIKRNINPR